MQSTPISVLLLFKLNHYIYGWRFHPVLKTWRLHRGVDLRAEMMTPLVAAHDGVAQLSFSPGGGNELRIIGSDGVVTRYMHLSRAIVDPGTNVSAGQQVALSGNTGNASAAPHLHFEASPTAGRESVNPEPLLCPEPSRKPGADQIDGFPILACKPEQEGSCTPESGSVVGGESWAGSPGPTPQQFDDMSTNEIFMSEVMKRFGNPDWYARLQERTAIPLIAEYVHMLALESAMALEKSNAKTRVETLLAARMARANKREMASRLERQREAAARISETR